MNKVIKTSAGSVTVEQTAPTTIEIKLSSTDTHPGSVTVKVVNEVSGDSVNLTWKK